MTFRGHPTSFSTLFFNTVLVVEQILLQHCKGDGKSWSKTGVPRGNLDRHFSNYLSSQYLRTPVMIFLSDGICSVSDQTVQDLCRDAVSHGLVSFPPLSKAWSDYS